MEARRSSQCTYRCVVLPDYYKRRLPLTTKGSQCTYRCVVLPDESDFWEEIMRNLVSMHLQVRGAP